MGKPKFDAQPLGFFATLSYYRHLNYLGKDRDRADCMIREAFPGYQIRKIRKDAGFIKLVKELKPPKGFTQTSLLMEGKENE